MTSKNEPENVVDVAEYDPDAEEGGHSHSLLPKMLEIDTCSLPGHVLCYEFGGRLAPYYDAEPTIIVVHEWESGIAKGFVKRYMNLNT